MRMYANNGCNRRWHRDYQRGLANGQCSRKAERGERLPNTLGAEHPYRLGFAAGVMLREAKREFAARLAEIDGRFKRNEITADERNAAYGRAA